MEHEATISDYSRMYEARKHVWQRLQVGQGIAGAVSFTASSSEGLQAGSTYFSLESTDARGICHYLHERRFRYLFFV
jgi:hypothetical protein